MARVNLSKATDAALLRLTPENAEAFGVFAAKRARRRVVWYLVGTRASAVNRRGPTKRPALRAFLNSGGGIRTRDLRIMSRFTCFR